MPYRYINETLLKDEKLIYFSRPHWIIFGPGVATMLVALLFLYFGPTYFSLTIWANYQLYQICAAIAALVGVFWLLQAYIKYRTSEFAITDKRVIMKTGWVSRNALEIFLRKLEAINVNQTVTGRILNYGTIVIIGTGGTEDFYLNVPNPISFRKRVQQQAELLIDSDDRH